MSADELFTEADRHAEAVVMTLNDIRANPVNVNERVRRACAHARQLTSALIELDNRARGVKPPSSDYDIATNSR